MPALPPLEAEADATPKTKPSAGLIAAMKRCVKPNTSGGKVKLKTDFGIEAQVTADLPWFSGVSSADILSAVMTDATCFTPEQAHELRQFVDLSVRSILPSPPAPPAFYMPPWHDPGGVAVARGARGRVWGGRSPRQPPEKAPDEEKKRLFVFLSRR